MAGLTKLLLLRLDQLRPGQAWLSPAEARRVKGFSSPQRRQQYLAGRWALRKLLSERCGHPGDWSLPAEGPPIATHRRGWLAPWLSLAHSGPWVLAALSESGPLGVDIEALGRKRPWKDLAAYHGLRKAGSERAFLRFWVEHEARYKARLGLKQGIAQVWQGPGFLACLASKNALKAVLPLKT